MARVIAEQRNIWGAPADQGGLDPQRTDLFIVDFKAAIAAISRQVVPGFGELTFAQIQPVPSYFVQSVSLPDLRVRADTFRRDSRPFNMPSWDEPLDPIRMTFLLDARSSITSSHVYQMLDKWRMLVRAGRGQLTQEPEVLLNANYRVDFAFSVYLALLRGDNGVGTPLINGRPAQIAPEVPDSFSTAPSIGNPTAQENQDRESFLSKVKLRLAAARASTANSVARRETVGAPFDTNNDLRYSGLYVLEKCWLASFKINDLSYQQAQLASLEATFYAENIVDNASVA